MKDSQSEVAELASEAGSAKQVADAACQFEKSRTGFAPAPVTAVLENHSLVITLHGVLSSAEKDLTKTPDGADQVRDLHRQIFHTSSAPLRKKMENITGVAVLEATSETNPDTDSVSILDDDALLGVSLSIAPSTLVEASGTSIVTATLPSVSGQDVTVDLIFSGTATNLTDYTRSAIQIVIPAGNLTGTVTLTAVQDSLDEINETIVVDIGGVTNGVESGVQQVVATIIDDDLAPSVILAVSPLTIVEAAGTARPARIAG